jgi:hypothetical protein
VRSLPRARCYRPQDPRVPVNGMWMRQLGEDELQEWFRKIERIYALRTGQVVAQPPRLP